MLHPETVDDSTLELLRLLQNKEYLKGFYLTGGTALALYLGHRKSVDIDLFSNFGFDVTVEGDLTIRDATNKISTKGTIEVVTGGINANSKFNIAPEDYKINIPGVVREKIAKNMEVTVAMKYAPLENK